MLRRIPTTLLLAALFLSVPATANAADDPVPSDPATPITSNGYVPNAPPPEPTLAGSIASSVCSADAPYITYDVTLTDPANLSTGHTAFLTLSDGTNTEKILLGDLVGGHVAGRLLWPGASVDSAGVANGWPGWVKVGGKWVETDGNYAWTRAVTSATISVNPEVVVPLAYPPATPLCTAGPPTTTTTTTTTSSGSSSTDITTMLSSTGVSALTIPIGIVAILTVVAGIFVLAYRRRTTR